ncbi:MAG: hypothetical protein HXS41_10740, partial [Theionarchaea archaeon]|nr:hypothetical protein [Theionarchaea archaeon]
ASAVDLVKKTEFSYTGSGYLSESTDVLISDSQTLKSSMHFEYDSKGRTTERISKDENGTQTEKTVYTYNNSDKVIRQDVYAGTSTEISYSAITGYDNSGNVVYARNPEGAEHYYSYANTTSQNQFIDSKGSPVNLFSNQFYTNPVPSHCHTFLVGEAFINNGKVTESYYKYDSNGNMIETKTLYPTRDYAVFQGTFDENGQTTFDIDLTGLTITDAILVISSIAVPTQETFYETHSEAGKGWQDTGTWSGKYFLANYYRCYTTNPPDCFDGSTKIGPFEHYPGTPNYTGYTTWIEENTQYVESSYTAVINEYPERVEYNLNNSSWNEITDNLGSGTTSTTIPAFSFVQGANTLQIRESNAFSTEFDCALYMDQGALSEEYTTMSSYDSYGKMTSITDTTGSVTHFEYDVGYHAYLVSITDALNHTVTATYDLDTGLLSSLTDPQGNTTTFEYDILGRATKKTFPDLTEIEAVYNDQGNSVILYDELDHFSVSYYDGLGRTTTNEWYLAPSEALTETYAFNYLNKVILQTDLAGNLYSYEYDSLGRPTRLTRPDSFFREMHYDDISNTITFLDENLHKKQYHYDRVGDLLWVREYTDSVNYYLTQYTYDSAGNLTSFTDANGNSTFYSYDSLFGLTQISYPDLTTEIFSYDTLGNISQKTNAFGTTTFTYNEISQLIHIVYPDSNSVSFEYDSRGNCILMIDQEGYTSHTYDNRSRILYETRSIEGLPYTVSYEYDAASRMISMTYPDQSVVTYEYDALNRLISMPGYAQFSYTLNSLLDSVAYTNGVTATYQYDLCGRPISIHAQKGESELLQMSYQYDPVGNISQLTFDRMKDQQWMQSQETYQYDWLDRLVSVEGTSGSVTYSYDPVGNRLLQSDLTYIYNTMNELISIGDGTAYSYDECGNTVTRIDGDTWLYSYDTQNMLVQVNRNQQLIAEYTYDGSGSRIKKREWSEDLQSYQTKVYVYSGESVIYEKNTDTEQEAAYVYGGSARIAKDVDEMTDYYITDHIGSTRLITDEYGNSVSDTTYQPFGESELKLEPYLFTGKERDTVGLYYYGARYYDPATGRFITRDGMAGKTHKPQSLNRYIYCYNNPLKYIDPVGLSEEFFLMKEDDILNSQQPTFLFDWENFLQHLYSVEMFGFSPRKMLEFIMSYLTRLLQSIVDSYGLVAFDQTALMILSLMAFLEALVNVFGDFYGISGAFICIEGMLVVGAGGQIGLCLTYHPDLGWAMYYYAGYLMGLMEAGGISIIAGFWTWLSKDRFTFDDWKGWFFNIAGTAGAEISGNIVYFEDYYWPPHIRGFGVGAGGGFGAGGAIGRAKYFRAEDWMIPYFLRGKVVPRGS